MIESTDLIIKSNSLVEARYKLTIWESRVFAKMITMIQKDDKDFKTYEIGIKELMDFFGTTSHNDYERIKKVPEMLLKRTLKIPSIDDGKDVYNVYGFVSKVTIPRGEKQLNNSSSIKLRFDPDLKPYLLQLKERFLQYDIKNILRISSPHSIRIYELLKQYEQIGQRSIEVKELRKILGIEDKYPLFANLKQRVIKPAQKHLLEYTDIGFKFKELKKGRKIYAIKFLIYENKANRKEEQPQHTTEVQTVKQVLETMQSPQFEVSQEVARSEAMDMMLKEGIIYDVAAGFLKKYDNEKELIQELRYIKKQLSSKQNIISKPALIVKMLEEQNFKKQRLYKQAKEEEARKQKQEEIEWHKEQIEGIRQKYKQQRNQAVMVFINKIGQEQTALLVEKYKKNHPTTCQAIENVQEQGDKNLAHDYKCGLFAKELENESLHDFHKYLATNYKYKIVIIEGNEYLARLK